MKRHIALGVALAILVASPTAEAQLRGLLKKKAGEVLGAKPEPAKPAPAPQPEPAAPATATETPAPSPAAAPAARAAAPRVEKKSVSPLEITELPVRQSATEVLRRRVNVRDNGDWDQLPGIPSAAAAAAYALGDAARVALVETVGAALKTLVMSPAFLAEHDAFVKNEHHGVDHGLKGIVGAEEAMKKNDFKMMEAIQSRQMTAILVDAISAMPPVALQQELTRELPDWKKRAASGTPRDRAKYQKLVSKAQSLEGLAPTDEKFLRGYAVLKSIDNDGPDTEEAVFAVHRRVTDENEQIAYDEFNLKGQLKQTLSTFVAIAAKVKFDAPTVEKKGRTVFTNAADEKQGAIWKACFRAGPAPTAAAVKLAKAWLAEM